MKHHNRQLLDFLLFDVLIVESLCKHDFYKEHNAETFKFSLDMAENIAAKYMQPFLAESDRKHVPELIDGKVKVHPAIKELIKAAADTGLLGATLSFERGGQQLPKTIFGAMEYILIAAHNSFVMYPDLVNGCSSLIYTYGSEELKDLFLPNMLGGKWLGTMCLTEPQAGSSLSDIKTTAIPNSTGSYNIEGQKVFISAGDHDVSHNIINLVLARIEGAPEGTKGISLFIVPKYKIDDEAVSNNVKSIAVFHKMGQKATAAMHLSFGEGGATEGFLLGEANKGLLYMFQMMNSARLGVGMTGISIASAAYQHSLQYARERVQGKPAGGGKESVHIIKHADVRRMLMHQKAIVESGLAMLMQCFKFLDLQKTNEAEKEKYDALAELLTPVAKAYGSEMGLEAANNGLQVLGGYGYTEDFLLEQLVRDVRIAPIYEGTTGIQSLALLGREIMGSQGKVLTYWKEEVMESIRESQSLLTAEFGEKLERELDDFQYTTIKLLTLAGQGNISEALSDATLYMEYFGIINAAWCYLKMGNRAQLALDKNTGNSEFNISLLSSMKYFYEYIFVTCSSLKITINQNTLVTQFDPEREVLI